MNKWIAFLLVSSMISVTYAMESVTNEAESYYLALSSRVERISNEREAIVQQAAIVAVISTRNPHVTARDAVRYAKAFYEASKETGTDIALMLAVAETESNFDPAAISTANARGLMQVMPLWAEARVFDFLTSPAQLFNPEISIRAGAHILAHYADKCGPEVQQILACYHGGPRARFRPANVTLNYIKDVQHRMVVI